ncbi:hypothetical protein [Rhodospirillum sp. A1_3_36]|uniref:hypothetical protein n=1 Tax=Rhodospirillum sp. A1_3_36 TaxID=3391666 RepID=UPI0039A6D350
MSDVNPKVVAKVAKVKNSDLILAGGTLTAQVSGAVSNNQGAILSGGDMAITGLGGGRAGSITNSLGVIQSDGGDVLLRAGSIHNQGDSDFEVKENVLIYEGTFGETPGVPARNSVPGAVITPEGYAYMKDGSTVVIDHPYPGLDWTVYYDTGNVTVKLYGTVATATGASTGKGEIVAGRNLTIDAGGEVLNDFSTLAAGGDLAISANSLVNKGIENVATLWFEWATNGQFNRCFGGPCVWFRNEGGTVYAGEIIGPGVGSIIQAGGGVNINVGTFDNTSEDPRDHDSWDMKGLSEVTGVGGRTIIAAQDLDLYAALAFGGVGSGLFGSGSVVGEAASKAAGKAAGEAAGKAAVEAAGKAAVEAAGRGPSDRLSFGALALDGLSGSAVRTVLSQSLAGFTALFRPAAPSSRHLYETRFDYTDFGTFYGSDYFQEQTGISFSDPNVTTLGDATFDSRTVASEIQRIAGKRWLNPSVTTDTLQVKALIDNAAAQVGSLQLTPGIALSKEQVAALNSDIVWCINPNEGFRLSLES